MTYGELRDYALRLAQVLRRGDGQAPPCLLALPSGLEYVVALFACFYAGRPAVLLPPWAPGRAAYYERLLEDMQVEEGLAMKAAVPSLGKLSKTVRWLAIDEVTGATVTPLSVARSKDVAYVQFTSGSSGSPQPVRVRHAHALANANQARRAYGLTQLDHAITWAFHHHSSFLGVGVVWPLVNGFPSRIIPTTDFLQDPLRWLAAISSERATLSSAPASAYGRCATALERRQRLSLDLSCWEVARVAGEPHDLATLRWFAQAAGASGFNELALSPAYGLTEATLGVSATPRGAGVGFLEVSRRRLGAGHVAAPDSTADSVTFVSSGYPFPGTEVIVANSSTVNGREIGDIIVRGPSVAGTCADPAEGGGTHGRTETGDRGFLHRGQLYVTGRAKEIVNVRGQKWGLVVIEETIAQAWPDLRGHVYAFPLHQADGAERLGLIAEGTPASQLMAGRLEEVVRLVAATHGLRVTRVYSVPTDFLPRTSTGKVARLACHGALRNGRQGSSTTRESRGSHATVERLA